MTRTLFLLLLVFVIAGCNPSVKNAKNFIDSKNILSKTIFIKGMTCGGCILGVKIALEKSDSLHIVDKKISVGKAILLLDKQNIDESKLNCEISKVIEESTEFTVFVDKAHTQPACKSK